MRGRYGSLRHLVAGKRYRVVRAFTDYDKNIHEIGEAFEYDGHDFLPYEDGYTIYVVYEGDQHRSFRMQDAPWEQSAVIGKLADYLVEIL